MKLVQMSSGIVLNLDNIAVIHPPRATDGVIVIQFASGQVQPIPNSKADDFEAIEEALKQGQPTGRATAKA